MLVLEEKMALTGYIFFAELFHYLTLQPVLHTIWERKCWKCFCLPASFLVIFAVDFKVQSEFWN